MFSSKLVVHMVPPIRHKYTTCVTSTCMQFLLHVYTNVYTLDASMEEAMHDGLWISYSIRAHISNSINQQLASNTCKTSIRLLEVDRDLSNILLPWKIQQVLLVEDLTSQTHELHSPTHEHKNSNHD